jgi:hypothetical protein
VRAVRKQERGDSVPGWMGLLAGVAPEHNLACTLGVTYGDPGLATICAPDQAEVAKPVGRV